MYTCGDGLHGKLALGEDNIANHFKPVLVTRFAKFTVESVRFFLTCGTHTHTTVSLLFWNMSGTTRVSSHQKGKTNLDLLEQEIVSGSGIC